MQFSLMTTEVFGTAETWGISLTWAIILTVIVFPIAWRLSGNFNLTRRQIMVGGGAMLFLLLVAPTLVRGSIEAILRSPNVSVCAHFAVAERWLPSGIASIAAMGIAGFHIGRRYKAKFIKGVV